MASLQTRSWSRNTCPSPRWISSLDTLTEYSTWPVDSWFFHLFYILSMNPLRCIRASSSRPIDQNTMRLPWCHLPHICLQMWGECYMMHEYLCVLSRPCPLMVRSSSQVLEMKRFASGMYSAEQGWPRWVRILAWETVVPYGKSVIFQLLNPTLYLFFSGICVSFKTLYQDTVTLKHCLPLLTCHDFPK